MKYILNIMYLNENNLETMNIAHLDIIRSYINLLRYYLCKLYIIKRCVRSEYHFE